jgi:hypothetical protein
VPNIRTLTRSFNGGEVTPEFYANIGDSKFQTGLATCRNYIVAPHGPVRNRPGTRFVKEVKDSTKATKLIPFSFSVTQTMCLEFGEEYIRFHTQGGTLEVDPAPAAYNGGTTYDLADLVTSSGIVYYSLQDANMGNTPVSSPLFWYPLPADGTYEIPSPYQEADLFDLHYVQSADILTIVHPNYPVYELRRFGANEWTLVEVEFASDLAAPANISAAPTVATGSDFIDHTYTVTAVDATGIEESLPGTPDTVVNNLLTTGNYNTITWDAVTGAVRYNVYKEASGLFSYLGQADGLSFKDDNIVPDFAKTPPIENEPFDSANNYPGAVTYFEQRKDFAGTNLEPQNIWMTRSGTEKNMSYSIPTRDDDSIEFRIAAREANRILHLVPLTNLIVLTASAEFRITSINSDAITPTSISVRPQSYIGSSNVQPVIVNNALIYAAARGGHLRELGFNLQQQGYVTGDLSLRAPHLFDGLLITDMSYTKAPEPIVWSVSSSGKLLGLTYVPEQSVGAIHQHDTYTDNGEVQSLFESIACVAEGEEDAIYVVVKRSIDGNDVRYVERFASRAFAAPEDAFFVDCGATYDGAPVDTLSGLDWLEGETVSILADGAVHPQRTVTSGVIELDAEYSVIQVGLPINADIVTLPLVFEAQAYGQGRQKNINKVWLRVNQSGGIFAGPSFDDLVEAKQRTTEPMGSPPALKSEEVELLVKPSWGDSAQLYVRQSDPLPLTIIGITMEVAIGG